VSDYIAVMSGDANAESEFYADKFAAMAGFRGELVDALRKLNDDDRFTAESELIERRINELIRN
jgi:Zn-dependent protease with chaperone function